MQGIFKKGVARPALTTKSKVIQTLYVDAFFGLQIQKFNEARKKPFRFFW
jgi:hypothetical protein